MLETNLKLLTAAYGPSGREERVRTMLTRLAEPLCKELRTDALGNLIAFRPGSSGKKLMLCAHMDQIGLMVTDIDEKPPPLPAPALRPTTAWPCWICPRPTCPTCALWTAPSSPPPGVS